MSFRVIVSQEYLGRTVIHVASTICPSDLVAVVIHPLLYHLLRATRPVQAGRWPLAFFLTHHKISKLLKQSICEVHGGFFSAFGIIYF